ncbi:MAG TPA: MerR family transcriptional regulator [Dehalococcoidia bacterium]|nr:MerR family transcriptional regulator [Dehalococcoidia bacterium]
MEIMTVSKAARQVGCSERWLRQAEKQGKIPTARRDLNGWRVYTEEDIEKLKSLLIPES